jgi:hypothetical protein
MTTAQLLEIWHKHPAQSHLAKLATWELPGDDSRQEQELRDALTQLELQWTEQQIRQIPPRIAEQGPDQRSQLLALQQKRQALISALQGD